jgi:hypothetical protein
MDTPPDLVWLGRPVTLHHFDHALTRAIDEARPVNVRTEWVKREVALHWLRDEQGFLARLRLARRLLFGDPPR